MDIFPDLLSIHSSQPDRYPFLLESTLQNATDHDAGQSRYDILFAFPERKLVQESSGHLSMDGRRIPNGDFLDELDLWFTREQDNTVIRGECPYGDDYGKDSHGGLKKGRGLPLRSLQSSDRTLPDIPFRGGWFLYLGYELAGQVEPVLHPHLTRNTERHAASIEAQFPIAVAWRVPAAIIRDKHRQETILIAEASHAACMVDLKRDVMSVQAGVKSAPIPDTNAPLDNRQQPIGFTGENNRKALPCAALREDPADEFLARVDRIKRYIHEGDVFQVNLSRGWQGCLREGITSSRLYDRLRQHNPAAFAGLAVWDNLAIISSSPERLVRIRDGVVETRPIAGTHPRNRNRATDHGLSNALMSHPKERAEHIMLIDLERNDLGRVCQPGSVRVDELMVLESYAHVHHIVSNIRGALLPDTTPGQVLRAVFPGGTITGCPKVRCMEIIAELEQVPRGPYTGAMGYLNLDGSADLNILIRSICRHGDRVGLRAGAGIVADSLPERELDETRHKARGPLSAL
ncbi:MAG: chorismate-binding protein [Gammaproteobacteria bacterium]|nr:chorismate-binding protein [Gammaproteobacteria bacterium]